MEVLRTLNKRLIFASAITIALLLAIALAEFSSTLSRYAFSFLQTVQLLGLIEMVINGTFITTRYFKITLALLAIFFVGALLSMVHPTSSDIITLCSIIGIFITYSIHFSRKKPKTFLDIMKLLTPLFIVPLPLVFFRPISLETKNAAILLGHAVFGITFVLYILKGERRNVWFVGGQKETQR